MRVTETKWFLPLFCVALGFVIFGAQWIGGDAGSGLRATAISGLAVITAIIVAFVIELARGHDGSPFTWLGAIAGLTYLAAVVVFRVRG
jgi:presenilin-like A22 family membrane protease